MRNWRGLRIGIYVLLVFVASCSTVTPTGPVLTSTIIENEALLTETLSPVVLKTSTPENVSTAAFLTIPRTHYQFYVKLSYDDKSLSVEETIEFTNTTGRHLFEIPLLYPEVGDLSVIVDIDLFSDKGQSMQWTRDNRVITIALEHELLENEKVNFLIQYNLMVPNSPGPFGYTSSQMNLCDWYFFIPPYDQETGWKIHERSGIGEHRVYGKADFEVKIEVDSHDQLQIAAPVIGISKSDVISFKLLNARDFSLSISPNYRVYSKDFGSFSVFCYTFTNQQRSVEAVVENTAKALVYFGSAFEYPYTRAQITIVEADFPDGMERDGLYFLSEDYFSTYDGTQRNYLMMLSAHETAHQWWYGTVANDQALEPWLDEALSTYSEALFYEYLFPDDLDWWWKNRVEQYQPSGAVDTTIYEKDSLREYINAVYLRGVIFLQALRLQVGDQEFMRGLVNYLQANVDLVVDSTQFFSQFPNFENSELQNEYFSP